MTISEVRDSEHSHPLPSGFRRVGQSIGRAQSIRARVRLSPNVLAVGIGFLCTVAAWPSIALAPTTGLDPSWQFGLAETAVHHIAWGPRLDFTFGPLGFLT